MVYRIFITCHLSQDVLKTKKNIVSLHINNKVWNPISTCRCIWGYSNWRYSEGSINLYQHVMLPVQQMSPSTARHHWMHLKDSGGIYVQTADQSFFKVARETEAICWQWHHWHLSYHSLLTQWHYFQSEIVSYLTHSSLPSASCLESLHHQQTPYSFFILSSGKMPKIILFFLHNIKLIPCICLWVLYTLNSGFCVFITIFSLIINCGKNLNCFVYTDKNSKWSGVMFCISLYQHTSSSIVKQLQSFWTPLILYAVDANSYYYQFYRKQHQMISFNHYCPQLTLKFS